MARHWLASSHSRSVVCLAAAIACFTYARGGEALQPESQPRLKVSVLAGEGVVHNLREPTPAEIVVEVRNEAGEPVAGAIVVFQLPSMGPSGLFPGETLFATVVSDSQGRAAVKGLRPNSTPGKWTIAVTASYQGITGSVAINQVNEDPAARVPVVQKRRGSGKIAAAVAVAAGAAAAGGLVALRQKSVREKEPVTPPPTATKITLGSITVGSP